MFRRRRPLARAAVVGGVAYHAGKKRSEGQQADAERDMRLEELEQQQAMQGAPPPAAAAPAAPSVDVVEQLQKLAALKDQGILTEEEFADQKRKLLASSCGVARRRRPARLRAAVDGVAFRPVGMTRASR